MQLAEDIHKSTGTCAIMLTKNGEFLKKFEHLQLEEMINTSSIPDAKHYCRSYEIKLPDGYAMTVIVEYER